MKWKNKPHTYHSMVALDFGRRHHSAAFNKQQNIVRGVFGNRRKRSFNASPEMDSDLIYRTNIRRAMLGARAVLDLEEFAEFLGWFEQLRIAEFGSGIEVGIGFDYLNGMIAGPKVPISKEIGWIAARLLIDSRALSVFRASARELDALCVDGDYVGALAILAAIVARHGESMWSVQLRLALEQRRGGLEAQKTYLQYVRGQYRQGILAYVAYNTSVRNEERTSWQRFKEGIRTASAKRTERPLADYLNYRLLNDWPATLTGVTNVLRLEQSHSIVDLYETFVGLCQLATWRADLQPLLPALRVAATALNTVDDFRLLKVAQTPLTCVRDDAAPAALADGDAVAALKAARSGAKSASDPWAAIYAAGAYAVAGKDMRPSSSLFSNLLVRFMASKGSTSTDVYELEKLCHNFVGLPVARGIAAFVTAAYAPDGNEPFRFERIGLNSPLDGQEDLVGLLAILDRPTAADARTYPIASALKAFGRSEFSMARDVLRPFIATKSPDGLGRLADLTWLRCADAVDDFPEVVATISRMGSADISLIPLLPITEMLSDRRAQEFKALDNGLAPLNVLNMLWKVADDDAAASTLKLMTGQFLRSRPERRPSLLSDAVPPFDAQELIYFLREVCVPNVLDVSRVFSGSRSVMEERQSICGVLHILDTDHADQYSAEVAAITRRLKVDEGLKIVDQSRIHVDTDAVTRWARRNLSEDFARYVDLVDAGIGTSGNFDEALREVKEAIKSPKQGEFFTPQNEADNALVRLLRALSGEFLNSSTCGLDYFLSKRIRHVSFIGLVRGPLEFTHLIANKPTAQSEYGSNPFWLNKLTTLSEEDRNRVDHSIRKFSKTFDSAVNRLKDEVLHVRSDEYPIGIFDIPLSTTVLTLARAILSEADSFEDFLDSVYIIFWAVLETSLTQARRIIDDQLKMQIAHAMDELKAEIGTYAHDDPAFSELSAALSQAGTEVQASLGVASSWFSRPEIREVLRLFTLEEALDVAIESALKLYRGFSPKIDREVIGEISLSAPDLVFVTDAILVAFSNIKAYSRLEKPAVEVTLRLDSAAETLTVEIYNEVHPSTRSAAQDRRIEEISRSIEFGETAKMSRTEGGSGFVKLATVAHQSSRGRIEFGYVARTRFRLSVTYSIFLDTTTLGNAQ